MWTKLVPKHGLVFDRAMKHLIDLRIREEATKYSNLSTVIIQHQLSAFAYRLGGGSAPGRTYFGVN